MSTQQNKLTLLALITILVFNVGDVNAQDSNSNIITNTTIYENQSSTWLKKIKPDGLSYFSQITGPSLTLEGNPNRYDGTEDTNGQSSWHQLSIQYKLNNGFKFVFNPRFIGDFGPDREGVQRNRLTNPVFGITGTWYKNGNFTFSGGINNVAYVVEEGDREDGLLYNPGGFQSLNYKLNNKVDLGSWLWARYRYFENNPNRSRAPMFFAPYVSYTVSDKLSFTSFYQYNGVLSEIDQLDLDPDDTFNFLTAISINNYLTVQPIITLYRETGMDINQGNLNVWLSGRFF